MLAISKDGLRRSRALMICCALATASPAFAQVAAPPVPRIPTGAPSRQQIEPPRPTQATPTTTVKVESGKAITTPPCPLRQYDLQVAIQKVTFTGINGAALPPEILDLLADIGHASADKQPIAVVCDIRDRANERLRAAGYVATVQIPPQRVETGELKLEVITAHIIEIHVRGDAPPYRSTIAARAEQLKALNPLNERDAERILLLASDIPGLDVQLALRPAGTVPGEVIGDLTVNFHRFSLIGNVQNYGSRDLGREAGYARAEVYGLTGLSDVTYAGVSSTFQTDEQQVIQLGHLMGLGNHGLTLEGSFIYAWSRPDLGQLDLRSNTSIGRIEIADAIERTRRENTTLRGGLEIIDQSTRVFQGDTHAPLNRDRLRVAFLRAEGSVRHPRFDGDDDYFVTGSLELRHGLDILDATKTGSQEDGYTPSRIQGDAKAFVVRGEVQSTVRLSSVFSLAANAFGQWTHQPLLNFEEFALGNLTYGRGYDPGANSADRAIALRGEVRGKVYDSAKWRAELFGFYDSVWIWNLDTNATETDRRLGSWGGGVRALLRGRAYLEAMYAHPQDIALRVPDAKRATDRFLLSLTVQFGPGGR